MQRRKVFGDSESEDEAEELGSDAEVDEVAEDGPEAAQGEGLVLESDSDDAPEDVDFVRSRENALLQVKEVLEQIGRTKQKKKEKRRHKEEQFKEQKKKKLERLQQSRLPDDILADVASRPRVTPSVVAEETKQPQPESEPIASEESDKEDFDDEDYIPINKDSGIQAVCVQDLLKVKQSYVEKVASFREQHLYGRGITRQPVKEKMQQRVKRRAARQRQRPTQKNTHR